MLGVRSRVGRNNRSASVRNRRQRAGSLGTACKRTTILASEDSDGPGFESVRCVPEHPLVAAGRQVVAADWRQAAGRQVGSRAVCGVEYALDGARKLLRSVGVDPALVDRVRRATGDQRASPPPSRSSSTARSRRSAPRRGRWRPPAADTTCRPASSGSSASAATIVGR